jgi:hypothetical protein
MLASKSAFLVVSGTLAALLQRQSSELAAGGLKWEVDVGATHTESDWAKRLPRALLHLCSPWWAPLVIANQDKLFFTIPRKLKAGAPALMFFNKVGYIDSMTYVPSFMNCTVVLSICISGHHCFDTSLAILLPSPLVLHYTL